jgi:hypothetical protein
MSRWPVCSGYETTSGGAWRSVEACTEETSIARAIIRCQPRVFLHRDVSHRSLRVFDHHQRMRQIRCTIVTPGGDGPDALLVCRVPRWEAYFTTTAEGFAEEITIVQQHLSPEEVPPLAHVPHWMIEAFVQWPSALPSAS